MARSAVRLLLAALGLFGHGVAAQAPGQDSVRIVFFDVGQGDAALIITPGNRHVLIDAGPAGAQIVEKMSAFQVDTLDLVVASHNHADHIGGMPDVLGAFHVLQYMDNGVAALTKAYHRTVDAVTSQKDIRVRMATAREFLDRQFSAGGVALRIMAPLQQDESQNNNSIGVWVQYGDFNAVFPGDAEQLELAHWLLRYETVPASVVKVSHHGSANGTSAAWVKALSPRMVVVSVGAGNHYGHPSGETVAAWMGAGARVFRTDSVGTITVSGAKDGGFSVRTSTGLTWTSK